MATLNLGRIKPVFRGAYNNSTPYVVDDIVTSGGESFICILASTGNATSNATYWTKLAEKGTNGTDLTSTLTTQGDILIRDGSGLARLGYGTSGNVLTTKGSGQNPVWEPASGGKVLQVVQSVKSDTGSWSAHATTIKDTGLSASITPTLSSSKILIQYMINIGYEATNSQYYLHLFRGSTEINQGDADGSRKRAHNGWGGSFNANLEEYMSNTQSGMFLDSPSTTSATTYSVKHTDATTNGTYYINRSHRDYNASGYDPRFASNIILMEIGV